MNAEVGSLYSFVISLIDRRFLEVLSVVDEKDDVNEPEDSVGIFADDEKEVEKEVDDEEAISEEAADDVDDNEDVEYALLFFFCLEFVEVS